MSDEYQQELQRAYWQEQEQEQEKYFRALEEANQILTDTPEGKLVSAMFGIVTSILIPQYKSMVNYPQFIFDLATYAGSFKRESAE